MKRPRRLSRKVIYRHHWLELYVDKVVYPAGRRVDHHVVHFSTDSVAAIVRDGRGRILMIRSYRYIPGTIEWELPAGRLEKRESPLVGARREALEETGWETTGHRRLYTFQPVNGMSNKVFHVVLCRAARDTGRFDRNEVAGLRWFGEADLERMIRRRRIRDGYALTALLLHFRLKPR
jgi:ADP-ribose pyrophosphatase